MKEYAQPFKRLWSSDLRLRVNRKCKLSTTNDYNKPLFIQQTGFPVEPFQGEVSFANFQFTLHRGVPTMIDYGKAFASHYYTTFDTNRAGLANLYGPDSTMTFETNTVQGQAAIMAKLSVRTVQSNLISTGAYIPIDPARGDDRRCSPNGCRRNSYRCARTTQGDRVLNSTIRACPFLCSP